MYSNRPVATLFFELLHVSDYQSCKWFFTTVVIAKGGEFKSRQSQRPKSNDDDDNDERTTLVQRRSSLKPKESSRNTPIQNSIFVPKVNNLDTI